MDRKVAVIGLGYVGLPVALSFSKKLKGTIGFDIDREKINQLKNNIDESLETTEEELKSSDILFTSNKEDLKGADFFIIGVPTPVDKYHRPDLSALISASKTVGEVISKGAIVVYESTVYPGVTEEICAKAIEETSNLKAGVDFTLGYSPERINPGDKEHTLENVIKIVSAGDKETLEIVSKMYSSIVKAGVFKVSSIKAAEAAKVIENTQRDLNIALMNELSIIFDKLGVVTSEVLEAAGTKWNFLPFRPGLVGGHCIGVDPYYLTTKAEELGYFPEVILAGRRINDSMGRYVSHKVVKLIASSGAAIKGSKVGVLGVSFKENVPDLRNSRVPDMVYELKDFGVDVLLNDPLASSDICLKEYGLSLDSLEEFKELDALILAVNHSFYLDKGIDRLVSMLKRNSVFCDVKSVFSKEILKEKREDILYWSL